MRVRIAFIVLAGSLIAGVTESYCGVGDEIRAALERTSAGTQNEEVTMAFLAGLTSDQAVPALVAALADDFVGKKAYYRILTYRALLRHNAAAFPAGKEQLIQGLLDPSSDVQQVCCEALGPEALAAELTRILRQLESPTTTQKEKARLVRPLVGWKSHASAAYKTVSALFRDADSTEALRWSCARAMLAIGGLSRAIGDFRELDPVSTRVVVWSLASYFGENHETLQTQTDDATRAAIERARDFVAEALSNPDRDTRKAARESMRMVFGDTYLIVRSEQDFELDPRLREAFKALSREEPDPDLRQAAIHSLSREQLEPIARSILVRRAKDNGGSP